MRAVCFSDVQQVDICNVSDPELESDGDAIVRVRLAGLCGSDLHAYYGRETGIDRGTVLGHEFVGEVISVGSNVSRVKVGESVCAPFTTNCGECFFCTSGLTSRCQRGQLFGWREQSRGLHGGQASMVRVPLADATLMPIPAEWSDEAALLLGDNLSTGYFAADMVGVDPSGVYAVVGCGTVGLLAIQSAMWLGARDVIAVDPTPARLEIAATFGARVCSSADRAVDLAHEMTDGRGVDGVMELVGLPAAQKTAYSLVRPGGTMSVIGCHCEPTFAFSPSDAYDKNLIYRTGRCPARHYMSKLSGLMQEGQIDLSWCVTHRFGIEQGREAYEVFAGRKDGCIKAVLDLG